MPNLLNNSKSEYRNSKQIQNSKFKIFKLVLDLKILYLNIVSCFGFRASDLIQKFRRGSVTVPYRFRDNRGVALLPMILLLFSLVAVVGIAIAGISVSETTISSTKDASDEALVIAESGIQDALMKLSRNKDFTSAGYNLSVSGGIATIVVSGSAPGTKTITSSGTLNSKTRKIQAQVSIDANGKITYSSGWWQEVAS